MVVLGILGSNRNRVAACVNFYLRLIQPRFRVGVFHGVDLYLILVPTGDVHVAVDVVERNPAIGREGVGLMEFFGQGAPMLGCVRSEGEDEQSANDSQDSSQPGSRLAMSVHGSLPFPRLDVAVRIW